MKIRILCVGKCKEDHAKAGVAEYIKRLSKFAQVEVVEADDEKTPDGASDAVNAQIRDKEGARLLAKIRPGDYCIALAIDGRSYTSEEFAGHLESLMNRGESTITFIIGGSLGLSDEVLAAAKEKLSFSAFTFPHQLMRVILLEQVYRAFKIIKNEPYHK